MTMDTLAATRLALHRVAAYVVSPARRHATGNEIALVVTPGGFGTPPFGDDEAVRVEGTRLVRRRGGARSADGADHAARGRRVRRPGAGRRVGRASSTSRRPATSTRRSTSIADGGRAAWPASRRWPTARWRRCGRSAGAGRRSPPRRHAVARALRRRHRPRREAGGRRATYGGSPGDDAHPEPYLYVAPWARRAGRVLERRGVRRREPRRVRAAGGRRDPAAAALAFFERGRREIAA